MTEQDEIVTFNMMGQPPTLQMLAAIATQLEMHGSLRIINAYVNPTPGMGALMLGRVMDRVLAAMQEEVEATIAAANARVRIVQ